MLKEREVPTVHFLLWKILTQKTPRDSMEKKRVPSLAKKGKNPEAGSGKHRMKSQLWEATSKLR